MKIIEGEHNRTFTVTNIPGHGSLEISIQYTGDSNAFKGVALDHYVIPFIKKAFKKDVSKYPGKTLSEVFAKLEENNP